MPDVTAPDASSLSQPQPTALRGLCWIKFRSEHLDCYPVGKTASQSPELLFGLSIVSSALAYSERQVGAIPHLGICIDNDLFVSYIH